MAIRNRPPGLRYILLLLLFIFGTQVYSQEFSQDLGGYDGQAVNGSHLDTVDAPPATDGGAPQKRASQDIGSYNVQVVNGSQKVESPLAVSKVRGLELYYEAQKEGGDRWNQMWWGCSYLSPFLDPTALYDNGWIEKDHPNVGPEILGRRKVMPQDVLDIYNDQYFPGGKVSTDWRANLYYNWVHERSGPTQLNYNLYPAPQPFGRTTTVYTNQINPAAGIILCLNNYGPEFMIKRDALLRHPPISTLGPAPPMKFLSDVMFFQWKFACQSRKADISNLKFIFQRKIADDKTVQLVDIITSFAGEQLRPWPGKFYPLAGKDDAQNGIANALLASPQGHAVTFMLLQHANELGHRVPLGVRLFGNPASPRLSYDRHMLFYIDARPADVPGAAGPAGPPQAA
ncbi:hypothetical protein LTR27_007772 [Elasticomyces elasticus]|nr:hypothetical protein LTR27_007772 [Elasticomyces elasticus]